MTLQGGRDEGILIVNAYRVAHKKSDNSGPNTAFTREYTSLRSKGMAEPEPRTEVLKEIKAIVEEKRAKGYRPVVMIDANGIPNHAKDPDKELRQFTKDLGLVDVYHERYPDQI